MLTQPDLDKVINVALLRQWKRKVGPQQRTDVALEKRITLDVSKAELRRGRAWRRLLDEQLRIIGIQQEEILSVSVLAEPAHECDVAVTLGPKVPSLQRKHPITRGGRPIEGPRPRRTRATVRRGG